MAQEAKDEETEGVKPPTEVFEAIQRRFYCIIQYKPGNGLGSIF
jgi:hypothetical protein